MAGEDDPSRPLPTRGSECQNPIPDARATAVFRLVAPGDGDLAGNLLDMAGGPGVSIGRAGAGPPGRGGAPPAPPRVSPSQRDTIVGNALSLY